MIERQKKETLAGNPLNFKREADLKNRSNEFKFRRGYRPAGELNVKENMLGINYIEEDEAVKDSDDLILPTVDIDKEQEELRMLQNEEDLRNQHQHYFFEQIKEEDISM